MVKKLLIVFIFFSNIKAPIFTHDMLDPIEYRLDFEGIEGEGNRDLYRAKYELEREIGCKYREKLELPENREKIKNKILEQLKQSNFRISDNQSLPELLYYIADYTVNEYLDMSDEQILKNRSLIDYLLS